MWMYAHHSHRQSLTKTEKRAYIDAKLCLMELLQQLEAWKKLEGCFANAQYSWIEF
jgi:hypothetical protein